ncbi:MAG: acetyl-CoA carboxylase carboxyl transferase subunit beta [Bacilli bacterium]|nr:acetyl-CoA carboxylase carboxyl transferase subunit beta [Bacilli bacterium]
MLKEIFNKKNRYATLSSSDLAARREMIPEGIMTKCKNCGELLLTKELEKNLKVCPQCGYHFPFSAPERLTLTLDEGSFVEYDATMASLNPLQNPDYMQKVEKSQAASGLQEAIVTGEGTISGNPVVIGVMDARFILGSMGSVVGEKITRAVERAIDKRWPVVLFCASGGARMQEGIFSLMQMAKTSAAFNRLSEAGLLYISVLTNPTTGGVSASFAMQGDFNIAEPGAYIAFAGARVIEQTIREKLPDDFQSAEFLVKHGMLDKVVPRKELTQMLASLLDLHKEARLGVN